MGVLDDFTATFGEDALVTKADAPHPRANWQRLCVCGHVSWKHGTSIGGDRDEPHATEPTPGGYRQRVDGCVGPMRGRMAYGSITRTMRDDPDGIRVAATNPTCDCKKFRPVAEVDRPGPLFQQRMTSDGRHPFTIGIKALHTRILKLKDIDGDEERAGQELDRRFRWLDGARVCQKCGKKNASDIWPRFVNGTHQSEMRCAKCGDRA